MDFHPALQFLLPALQSGRVRRLSSRHRQSFDPRLEGGLFVILHPRLKVGGELHGWLQQRRRSLRTFLHPVLLVKFAGGRGGGLGRRSLGELLQDAEARQGHKLLHRGRVVLGAAAKQLHHAAQSLFPQRVVDLEQVRQNQHLMTHRCREVRQQVMLVHGCLHVRLQQQEQTGGALRVVGGHKTQQVSSLRANDCRASAQVVVEELHDEALAAQEVFQLGVSAHGSQEGYALFHRSDGAAVTLLLTAFFTQHHAALGSLFCLRIQGSHAGAGHGRGHGGAEKRQLLLLMIVLHQLLAVSQHLLNHGAESLKGLSTVVAVLESQLL